jgi:D-alanyl-D-alanine carboxypeptidase
MIDTPVTISATRHARISGEWYHLIGGGTFAGHWIPTAATGHQPLRGGTTLPTCTVADVLTRYTSLADWEETLVDLTYMVPRSYAPTDLAPVTDAGVRTGVYGQQYVRSFLIADLKALNDAARTAGHGNLLLNSAYRSYDTQTAWWNSSLRNNGYAHAIQYTARRGHSEHQLGTAVDINVFATSGLNSWMRASAHKYGFVVSYAPGRDHAHCFGTEDWHFRYFGRDTAAKMSASGLSPREYLWYVFHQSDEAD